MTPPGRHDDARKAKTKADASAVWRLVAAYHGGEELYLAEVDRLLRGVHFDGQLEGALRASVLINSILLAQIANDHHDGDFNDAMHTMADAIEDLIDQQEPG